MARIVNSRDLSGTLAAAEKWIDTCLIHDGAILAASPLWTPAVIQETHVAFVEHPDAGADDFITKLKKQMRDSSPQAQQLMAEMLWALLLFPSNVSQDTKLGHIRAIWPTPGEPFPVGSPLLSGSVLQGIGSGGTGFNTHRWRELTYLIAIAGAIKAKDESIRRNIFSNYGQFVEWIETVPQDGQRQFRHMLRFFAFPDRVERMSSNGDRQRILIAFDIAPKATIRRWSDPQLDSALFELRTKLQVEYPDAVLDFYEAPLRDKWNLATEIEPTPPNVWIEKTIVRGRDDRESGPHALGKALWSPQRNEAGNDIYRFMREVKPGDVVLHLTDNVGFTGNSRVESTFEEFEGVEGTEWGGSPAYRVILRDFTLLRPPLTRQDFFASPWREKLLELIDKGQRNLFYNREPNLRQGAYLTPASTELMSILNDAYSAVSGKPLIEGAVIEPLPPPRPSGITDLRVVIEAFAQALTNAGLGFGTRHESTVRSFVASLATKQFVILTGLSGSGKTQIAMKFGEWLGKEHSLVVPVRPDWTGAEALFGYEDVLQPVGGDGARAWHVPDVLAFMLDAAADRANPYLLILDEMNLAHVERYFADALSGMETRTDCLPNLSRATGAWRLKDSKAPKIPIPRNLFIVGTVNVDETTYLFSPKVLDRANTFEFRVPTESLDPDARRPVPCSPATPEHGRGFLSIASNDDWHIANPAPQQEVFVDHLLRVHALLMDGGYEFGHRVFYEAIRFGAMLAGAGATDPVHAVDLQIMQKVLPRLHGSRRRLEPTLTALGKYCYDLTYAPPSGDNVASDVFDVLSKEITDPELPISFDKIVRMTRSLRANQFTSYTD